MFLPVKLVPKRHLCVTWDRLWCKLTQIEHINFQNVYVWEV